MLMKEQTVFGVALAEEKEVAENFKKEVTTIKCLENDLKFAEHEYKEASKDAEDMLIVLK